MKEEKGVEPLFPASGLSIALKDFMDAKDAFNKARKKVGETKKKYLALGGVLIQEDLGPRNVLIYAQNKAGKTVKELSRIFNLSEDRIRTIIGIEKFQEAKGKR